MSIRSLAYSSQLLEKMNSKELGILLSCLLPLSKIKDNKYLIGVEAKELVVKSDRILIQGRGLKEFITRYALSNCLVIWRTM